MQVNHMALSVIFRIKAIALTHSKISHWVNSTNTMDAPKNLHIAMFPWLAYGHIMPYLEVAKFLAQKGHRISFISTPKNLQNIPKTLSPLIAFVELPLPSVDGLPRAAESTSELPIHKVPYLKKAYDSLQPSLTHFLETSSVDWIIHDFVAYWLPRVSNQLGINSGFLHISIAYGLAFIGPPSELLGGHGQKPESSTVVPDWLPFPSAAAFKLHEITGHHACMDTEVSDFERFGHTILGSRFVALRTCPEFESETLSLLRTLYRKPVLPVGLLPKPVAVDGSDGGERDENWEFLRDWLDKKEEKSVVYIAFGTEVTLSRDSAHEFARGIEKSGLPFIWVVKNCLLTEDPNMFPPGFEDRVLGRGLVWTSFAPQLKILAHSSVGGFLTHSGWSSVIEALGLGKPLILFPGASADLGLIARQLESKGFGLEVPRDERDGSFTSESVGESIRRVMVDKEGESLRAKAWSARDIFGNMELQNKYLEDFTLFLENVAASPADN